MYQDKKEREGVVGRKIRRERTEKMPRWLMMIAEHKRRPLSA